MLKIEKTQFSFFLLWFPTVSVCIYLGTLLAIPLGHYLYIHNGRSSAASNDGTAEYFLALMLLVGLFMGFGQWVAINTKIKKSYGWILATPTGFSVGCFVSFWIFVRTLPTLFQDISEHYEVYQQVEPFGMWVGICAGTCIFTGICQWVALRRNYLSSIRWSAVMTLSFVIGGVLDILADPSRAVPFIIFSIAVGLISGVFAEPLIIRPGSQKQEATI
jgi:hypothetical protein